MNDNQCVMRTRIIPAQAYSKLQQCTSYCRPQPQRPSIRDKDWLGNDGEDVGIFIMLLHRQLTNGPQYYV